MSSFDSFLTNPQYTSAYGFDGKGIVYIENERDLLFWESIIEEVHPNLYSFKRAVKEGSSTRGKRVLEKHYATLNSKVLVAIDSDFDYLSPNRNSYSSNVRYNPYVLHTFSFSRESVLCNINTLNYNLSRVKFFIPSSYRVDTLLTKFSEISYECLLPFCYLMDTGNFDVTEAEFHSVLNLNDSEIELNEDAWKAKLVLITEFVDGLKLKIEDEIDYNRFVEGLNDLGVNANTAYRFISGHLLKKHVDMVVKKVISDLRSKEIAIINNECEGHSEMIKERVKGIHNHFKTSCSFNTLIENCNSINSDDIYAKIVGKVQATANV